MSAEASAIRYTNAPTPRPPISEVGLPDVPQRLVDAATSSIASFARDEYSDAMNENPNPDIITRNAGRAGSAVSGFLNLARPLVHPIEACKNMGHSLRIGPIRAITGLAALGAAGFGRVFLGKGHENKNLGFFSRIARNLKNKVYGVNDWANQHHNFAENADLTTPKNVLQPPLDSQQTTQTTVPKPKIKPSPQQTSTPLSTMPSAMQVKVISKKTPSVSLKTSESTSKKHSSPTDVKKYIRKCLINCNKPRKTKPCKKCKHE